MRSDRYLTVATGGEFRNGGLVYVWEWKDSCSQMWEATHLGGSYYKLTVKASGNTASTEFT
ncbi:MAG: hypothetical protein JSV89_09955 [Spirochaetaceae bacterium]|nr:MAG: hypothetical protein JSV89_09955 [Spirochaetaceae bacterium]